jgi:hypothetical protein
MKKIFLTLSVLVLFCTCNKQEIEPYDKSFLLGNWKKIEIDLIVNCTDYLEFNYDTYRYKEICSGTSNVGFFINYKLDGQNIVVDDNVIYKIKYLSQDLLKLENSNSTIEEYEKP